MEEKKIQIKKRLKNLQSLPTLPTIITKLTKMVADEKTTAVQLGAVIEKDQVLTSKLLKMVNSAFFGFPKRISTVANAIVLLGFNVIKTLIITSSIFETMQSEDVGLWEHSLGCAAAAGIMARRLEIKDPEEVSTAALIHDLGKVVLRTEFPEDYEKIATLVKEKGLYFWQAEQAILGVDHATIGGWLTRQWNLPDRLVEPIDCHHHPSEAKHFPDVAAVVHFADILIKGLGYGFSGDPFVPPLNPQAWKELGFRREDLKEILAELDDRLMELQTFTLEMQAL
ncbi:HDOD domain-containing protein [Thermosulfuriphilus ammonigenes]|uniref:HDOD domain-containing protein n=1 Tax=Thermosulfuriphilus ammonigenes TaxID=1936021 RepID=A0A6G7PYK9_9BACT|nr:HDOD domain-containing protein [Thermosulfuriphilus ammonigenes]MBA2849098.1 putative nucleotidyltransferase with HDIG domain [Thermosulfuriphilus ammonigenes]QIJ72779.1 HDOD domain-containing protein [Thermosulfuriphilus ammonigenes]